MKHASRKARIRRYQEAMVKASELVRAIDRARSLADIAAPKLEAERAIQRLV